MVLDLVKEVFGEDSDHILVKEGISVVRTVKHECHGGKRWMVRKILCICFDFFFTESTLDGVQIFVIVDAEETESMKVDAFLMP